MKLSISLPDEDVEALDAYARSAGLPTRSAALRRAIRLLRLPDLEQDYATAWAEWESSGEQSVWEQSDRDGLGDAPR